MKIGNFKRALRFERLEQRSLLSGTVTAIQEGPPSIVPYLVISGDNGNNTLVIHETRRFSNGLVEVQVQGINTKIIGGFNIESARFTSKGYSFKFTAAVIFIDLGGGNDSLTIYNTTIPGGLEIHMAGGNDTLVMSNVHEAAPGSTLYLPGRFPWKIDLGTGNDFALLNNVSSTGNLSLLSDEGKTSILLQHVVATADALPGKLTVQLGAGNPDKLSVVQCSAVQCVFEDAGDNGLLHESGNQFGTESVAGFSPVSRLNILAGLGGFWSSANS